MKWNCYRFLLGGILLGGLAAAGSAENSRPLESTTCPWGTADGSDPDDCLNAIGSTLRTDGAYGPLERAASVSDFATGYLTASFSTSNDVGRGAMVLTDGSFIVFGKTQNGTAYWDVAMIKYLPNGQLDTSFNSTGKVITSFANYDDSPHAIFAHSNGTFLIGGRASNGSNLDFLLLRYTSNGQLDSSFGTVGGVRTAIGTGTDIVRDITVGSDGKVLAAGYTWDGAEYQGALARYETDGQLDTTFNTTGTILISYGTGTTQLTSVDLDTAGRIFAAGGLFITDWDAVGLRLISNGTFDSSFNTNGWSVRTFSTANDFLFAARRYSGDRYIGAGITTNVLGDTDAVTVRLTSDGLLDTSFATRGHHKITFGTTDQRFLALVMGTLGKPQLFGFTSSNGTASGNNFLAARYNSNGTLDTQWNASGTTLSTYSTNEDQILGVGALRDNLFYGVGWTQGTDNTDFAIARYEGRGSVAASGSLDRSFGTSGSFTITQTSSISVISGMYVDTNGKILVIGFTSAAIELPILNRYNANWTLDTSWKTNGMQKGDNNRSCSPSRTLTTYDGKYYLVCRNGRVLRLTTDGLFDATFNGNGATVAFASSGWGHNAMGIDSGGRIYMTALPLANPTAYLHRFTSNGQLDTSFRTTGIMRFTVPNSTFYTYHPIPMALNNSDKPVLGVTRVDNSENVYLSGLIRLDSDGTYDTTFGSTGYVSLLSPGAMHGNTLSFLSVDSTGSGYFYADGGVGDPFYVNAGVRGYGFGRLNSNGTADTSFANNGRYEAFYGNTYLYPSDVTVLPNGDYLGVMMGTMDANFSSLNLSMYRMKSNFSLDTTFGLGKGLNLLNYSGTHYLNYRQIVRSPDGFYIVTCYQSVCRYVQ